MSDQYGPEYIGDDEESLRRNLQAIPMGEIDTGEALEGHVAFTRSVNLGTRDDNAHYRIEMPFVVQPGWDWATIAAHAADAFWHCKAVVYDQAGLPFTVDEGGVLRETLRHQLPDAEPAPAPERHRPPEREPAPRDESGNGRPARTGGRFPHPRDMDQPEHIPDDIWWNLVDNFDDWYDNRPQKAKGEYKDTASDFVRKGDRKSVWLRPFAQASGGGRSSGGRGRGYDS